MNKIIICLLISCILNLFVGCVDTTDNINNEIDILNIEHNINFNKDYISIRFINNNGDIKYINNYDDKNTINLKISKDKNYHLYQSNDLFVFYDLYIPINESYNYKK